MHCARLTPYGSLFPDQSNQPQDQLDPSELNNGGVHSAENISSIFSAHISLKEPLQAHFFKPCPLDSPLRPRRQKTYIVMLSSRHSSSPLYGGRSSPSRRRQHSPLAEYSPVRKSRTKNGCHTCRIRRKVCYIYCGRR